MNCSGVDPESKEQFSCPQELWKRAQAEPGGVQGRYQKAVEYWDKQEASDDGVLGGFGFVSDADVRESRRFLTKTLAQRLGQPSAKLTAVDCGAGVGRVSEQLLLHHFGVVDLLEPSAHLIQEAQRRLAAGRGKAYPAEHAPGAFLHMGLQEFQPQPAQYDAIWIQWALLYLTDEDFVSLFQRCWAGLRPGGVVFVKENVCAEGFIVDSEDASITRSHAYMLDLFKRAGARVLASALQKDFPKGLFKVRMYALQKAQ